VQLLPPLPSCWSELLWLSWKVSSEPKPTTEMVNKTDWKILDSWLASSCFRSLPVVNTIVGWPYYSQTTADDDRVPPARSSAILWWWILFQDNKIFYSRGRSLICWGRWYLVSTNEAAVAQADVARAVRRDGEPRDAKTTIFEEWRAFVLRALPVVEAIQNQRPATVLPM